MVGPMKLFACQLVHDKSDLKAWGLMEDALLYLSDKEI